jgi:predicted transcriptional regulator
MKQDANSIVRERGPDALRALSDVAPVYKPKRGRAGHEHEAKAAAIHNVAEPKRAFNWRDNVITAEVLKAQQFPKLKWAIPGLIPEGLTLLIAKAKKGKTWMMQDCALAVAGERYTLGDKKPETGDALYLALEDNGRRLQRRFDKLLPGVSKWPRRLTLATKWRRLNEGGLDDIREWIKQADNPRLITIDTLKMVRAPSRGQNTQLYDVDYESLQPLRDLANEHGLAIVVLHHARKAEAEDPIDLISGSGGLAAAANTILVIAGTSQGTTLHVRGHDVEEADLAVEFNKQTCRWSILGGASEVRQSDERKQILDTLKEEGEPLTPSEIAKCLGKNRSTIKTIVQRLVRDGFIEKAKGKRGAYALAEKAPSNGNEFLSHWQSSD